MAKYAFFDVDQTIYEGYSLSDLYLYLMHNGFGGDWIATRDANIGSLYKSGAITYKQAGNMANELLAETLKELPVSLVRRLAHDMVSKNSKIRLFVKSLVSLLQKNDFKIILVSGSGSPIVDVIASSVNADQYFSAQYEVQSGKYTGNVLQMLDDVAKESIITKQFIDSKDPTFVGFGDSTGDIAMLSHCEHAFVVSPHQVEMRILAEKNKWHLVTDDTILNTVSKILDLEYSVESIDRNQI